ncbi:ligand-binding sensor domain-containing protein [Sphingomonas abietis]|uniref:diguanylate cyclase n=1 Tax=Sphingomonas abietis TaxID=3012344 RepID=A0ABY7NSM0_9SPHN|nr:ligand-binding sensor domain-containing diguanylate cyclase [Sphingomonas abietis]WBO23790.1 diguanylate cyclase [Sphingomonas abietis]
MVNAVLSVLFPILSTRWPGARDRVRIGAPSRRDGTRIGMAAWLAWAIVTGPALAAPGRWTNFTSTVFHNYGRDQGLPHPVPTAFAQSRDGFLWIGTQGGLARWDGYRFTAYKADPANPGSLPDDWIQTLHIDATGHLWIGTSAGHLARYDATKDRFDTVPLKLAAGSIHIGAITDDGVGGLWIGTDDGLRHLDPSNGRIVLLRAGTSGAEGLPGGAIQAVLRDRAGALWVGTTDGLARRPTGARAFVAVPIGDTAMGVSALFEEPNGRIWIGTTSKGLFVIDHAGATPRAVGTAYDLPPSAVSSICMVGPHEIWAGLRSSGIISVDTRSGNIGFIRHDRSVANSLTHNDVWALLRDDAGGIWVGGTGGLSYHPHDPGLVSTIYGAQQRPGSLSASDVLSILATRDGRIWLGYIDGSADIIDPMRGRVATFRSDPGAPGHSLLRDAVFAMTERADGQVYLATRRGLYLADPVTHGVALVPIPGRDPHAAINALAIDNGTLWIGGEYDGIRAVVPEHGAGLRTAPAFGPADAAKLSNPDINIILSGTGSDLWVGTRNGLNRIDLAAHAVEPILADPADRQALGGGFVSALLVDRRGRLWVGTFGGGLALMTGRDAAGRPRFRRFGVANGLPHENVDSLEMDGTGTIWAGTDDGLARVDSATFAIRRVGPADGSALRDYFVGSRGADAAGEALFGAKDGLTVVRPGVLPPWRFRPPVVVTDVRVGGISVPIAPFNHAGNSTPVVLTPRTNSLAVEFSALDFTAPERNHYAYKLDGFDQAWTETDASRRLAAYTNLPPGDYMLRLRGSNRDGLWTERDLAVPIRVLPSWSQQWWVRLVAALLLLLGIVALFRWRTGYLRRRQGELERQISERTADLRAANERLAQLATIDTLTGCANRRHFVERAHELVSLAGRHDTRLSLTILDLDDFKHVNDSWGHPGGDAVLAMTGQIFDSHTRSTDLVGRIGGEEFGLLMPHTASTGAWLLADRLRQAIAATVIAFDGQTIRVTASFGLAELRAGEDFDSLYGRADAALYEAKQSGRNRVSSAPEATP